MAMINSIPSLGQESATVSTLATVEVVNAGAGRKLPMMDNLILLNELDSPMTVAVSGATFAPGRGGSANVAQTITYFWS